MRHVAKSRGGDDQGVSVSALSDRMVRQQNKRRMAVSASCFSIRSFGSYGEAMTESEEQAYIQGVSVSALSDRMVRLPMPVNNFQWNHCFSIRSFGSYGEAMWQCWR